MTLRNSAELRLMNFGILNANTVQELPDAIRNVRRDKPHEKISLATLNQSILIFCELGSVLILRGYGLQLHQDICLKGIDEQEVESPHFSKRLLPSCEHKAMPRKEVVWKFGDEIFSSAALSRRSSCVGVALYPEDPASAVLGASPDGGQTQQTEIQITRE